MSSVKELLAKLDSPIAVVAHDAGAANHISAWFSTSVMNSVCGSFDGPAEHIFRNQCPWIEKTRFDGLLADCRTLISGTSLPGGLEHQARKLAMQAGINTIAVIDHWTNFRARFVRDNEEVLPDEIWVTDEYAKTLAEIEFPDTKINQVDNVYLANIVCGIKEHEKNRLEATKGNILYLLEPIYQQWSSGEQAGEFQALDFFIANLPLLYLSDNASIILRPHPSEGAGKYQSWLASQKDLDISLDESSSLAQLIAWSDVVVGCQTYAMVIALASGRKVVSSLPPWAPSCILPHTEILRLCELVARN